MFFAFITFRGNEIILEPLQGVSDVIAVAGSISDIALIVQQLSEKVFKLVVRMPNFTHWLSFARRSKCDKVPNDLMKFFSHLSSAGKAYF